MLPTTIGTLNLMKLAVPNAILFVLDPTNKEAVVPQYDGLVSRTDTCVSVGTQADVDGETEVSIGRTVPTDLELAFDGSIETPGRSIAVWTSERTPIGRLDELSPTTHFAIWVDDNKWPSQVVVVVRD